MSRQQIGLLILIADEMAAEPQVCAKSAGQRQRRMSFEADDSDDEGDVPPLLTAPPPGQPAPAPATTKRPPATASTKPAHKPAAPAPAPSPAAAPAASSKPEKQPSTGGPLPVRSTVRLHGLTGRPELNGCTGVVTGPPVAESGRVPVKLGAPHNQSIALKPANLELVAAPPAASSAQKPAASASSSSSSSASRDDLTFVRKDDGANPLKLADVQKSMEEQQASASKAQVPGSPNWVTPDLLQKVAADPVLRKAFTDPRCAAAMTALQTDPKQALEQYGDVPEMRDFLTKFMKLMGDHFTALGDTQEAQREAIQPVAEKKPETPEEEAARKAMADPEVAAILRDPEVQHVLQKLQMGKTHEVQGAMTKPAMVAKLRRLSQAGLIGMQWER